MELLRQVAKTTEEAVVKIRLRATAVEVGRREDIANVYRPGLAGFSD